MVEAFSRALARVTAAQVAEGAGFEGIQASANEALAELLLRYIGEVGAASHSYAELAGRSATNVFDLVRLGAPRAHMHFMLMWETRLMCKDRNLFSNS